ncbi:MAG: hypothetical protein ABW252_23195 [Polyangiales bacterium]
MYSTLLWIHSWWRWAIVIAVALALFEAWSGWLGGRHHGKRSRILNAAAVGTMDLQLLVGAVLYFISPLTSTAFANMGAAMKNPPLRFFTVEHGPTMVLVLVLMHLGSARAKRGATDTARHRTAAIWFTVATVLMLLAVPWPSYDVGRPLFR